MGVMGNALVSVVFIVLWNTLLVSGSKQVIMDVDPGIDDAMAILTILGDPNITVKAITCVRGNTEVDTVLVNLYKTLHVANKLDIPVYRGCEHGLVYSPKSDHYFGKDAFGDLGDKLHYDSSWLNKVQKEHASVFLARTVQESPGEISILAIGPLTNIAVALSLNPQFLKQAKEVIVLGGAVRGMGNIRPGIEFNFYEDPDATALVLEKAESSNVTIKLIPMETVVNYELGMKWRLNELSKVKNKGVAFLDTLEGIQRIMHPKEHWKYTPYDTYASCVVINPQKVINSTAKYYGYVETGGLASRGVLLVDYYGLIKKNPNLEVVLSMDKMELRRTITNCLSSLSGVSISQGWLLAGCVAGVCFLGGVMMGFVLLVRKVSSFGQGSQVVQEQATPESASVEVNK